MFTTRIAVLAGLALAGALTMLPAQVAGPEDRKCRHILLATEAQADDIISRIVEKGEGFAKLARRHSYDVVTKPLAGELGWIATANYEAPFIRAAYSVPEVNGVVKAKTSHGWHVIQVTEIKNKGGRKPAAASDKPSSRPGVSPRPRPTVNNDVVIEFELLDRATAPGEPVNFEIRVRNDSKKPQNVFNPSLWPLGLTVRYQFGPLNMPISHPESTPEPNGGFSRFLEPGETLAQRYVLQDYAQKLEPWPIIRMNWRANVFFGNTERFFPSIRGIEGYDAIRDQWKYYSSRAEQRLNVLPDYEPGQRWFAMLHSRGKVWVELKDPGVPGLLEHWIDIVRDGTYDRQMFAEFKEGSHFNAGGTAEDGSGQSPRLFTLPKGYRPSAPEPYSLSLELGRGSQGLTVGSRFYLTLGEPRVPGGAVQIGTVIPNKGTETLDSLASNYTVRGQSPRTMLGLVYTYDLLPEDVKALVDGTASTSEATAPAKSDEPLPVVVMKTEYGAIAIRLFEDDAPNTVANFINLIESKFYDGLPFHRKWSREDNLGFIQSGSPDGSPAGGAGYFIKDEINSRKHVRGTVAMARGKPGTASSQFYICLEDQPYFDGVDTVFGEVIEGLDVIDAIPQGGKIFRCGVQSKRDHEYKVEKLGTKPADAPRSKPGR